MKRLSYFVLSLSLGLSMACQNNNPASEESEEIILDESIVEEEIEAKADLDVDSVVALIDAQRAKLEAMEGTGMSLSTEGMRAKIAQKWSKIDFYTDDKGAVVRVKTYPYPGISKRTEEFYYDGVNLLLAVIEDDGSTPRTEEAEVDKMYYFYEWEPIKEVRKNGESEQGIRESDAEELLVEAREYLRIYTNQNS